MLRVIDLIVAEENLVQTEDTDMVQQQETTEVQYLVVVHIQAQTKIHKRDHLHTPVKHSSSSCLQ